MVGLVALVAAGIVLLAPSSDAADPSDESRIVYHLVDPSGGSYWEINPHTGHSSRITPPDTDISRGALEADGRSVVVPCDPRSRETSPDPEENTAICRIHLASGQMQLVVDTEAPVQHPTPAPDGSSIVFASGAEADHGLKITGTEGGEVRSLCSGFCPLFRFSDIAWSPDGSRVAFVATTPGSAGHLPQVYVVTVGDDDYTELTSTRGSKFDPVFSPDGRSLVFSDSSTGSAELWMMRADGSDLRQLTDGETFAVDPSFSPDGSTIVYSRRSDDGWELAELSLADGGTETLVPAPGSHTMPRWLP